MLPKSVCNRAKCEVVRFLKLGPQVGARCFTGLAHCCQYAVPIRFEVPRQSGGYQEDLYPPVRPSGCCIVFLMTYRPGMASRPAPLRASSLANPLRPTSPPGSPWPCEAAVAGINFELSHELFLVAACDIVLLQRIRVRRHSRRPRVPFALFERDPTREVLITAVPMVPGQVSFKCRGVRTKAAP
jgi:hypothetical protein